MNTDKSDVLKSLFDENLKNINKITEKIIGCSYTVSNTLGCGFLEKVYENALAHELRKAGFKVLQQHEIEVFYDGIVVGKYIADLFVEDSVIVELKAISSLDESQKAQCLNYLKATGLKIGLLINFGKPRIEIKRIAL
ncbi:MAG TPA: GxxExxY protein [Pyrinomonadaceae bacterium]|jgi:GxxExxY protein